VLTQLFVNLGPRFEELIDVGFWCGHLGVATGCSCGPWLP
jgi:hypothetical protein